MGLDIVEIAIEKISDHQEFEKIASEVLYNEGYYDIIPMPGGNDFGQDAIEDKFYTLNRSKRTVFQYSLQSYSKGKITKTLERLQKSEIELSEIIYVTNRMISGENQENLKREIRSVYNIPLTIFEKETFVNRLSDFKNGIFSRHFPDIDKQVAALKTNRPVITDQAQKGLELALLKVSLAFTFNKNANKARKNIFGNLILSLMYSATGDGFTVDEIYNLYRSQIEPTFTNIEQIRAALDRLKSEKLVDLNDSKYRVSQTTLKKLEANVLVANQVTETLLEDIFNAVSTVSKTAFSKQEQDRIKRNSQELLLEIFKFSGIELSNQFFKQNSFHFEISQIEHLTGIAKKGISPAVGELLIAVVANIFRSPTESQALIISSWAKAYLGVKIMNYDPGLKELQFSQFSKKIFVLDTDIVLNCLITERPSQAFYCQIIKDLLNLGCKVVIPTTVKDECLNNAAIAIRTYDFFRASLHSLSEEVVEAEVRNLFVQGYYYYYKQFKRSFGEYITNYFNEVNADEFFEEVIFQTLPEGVEIVNMESYKIQIPQDESERLYSKLSERAKKAKKAIYRTDDQSKEIAKNDVLLYLTCLHLNKQQSNPGRILGGKAYLLTQSLRYLKATKEIGIKDVVTTKPQTLVSILDLVGKSNISHKDHIRLMDNPLLIYSVESCWDDIQTLIKSGIDLEGKNIARLRWDLQTALHEHIAAYHNYTENPELDSESDTKFQKWLELIDEAKKQGYKKLPEIEIFRNAIENAESDNENLIKQLGEVTSQYETLKNEIERFGKRRQYYLEKLQNKKKK